MIVEPHALYGRLTKQTVMQLKENLPLQIVTLYCPRCPRKFRTTSWIAFTKQPSCPNCDVLMACSDAQDVSVLSRPVARCA